MEGLLPEVRPIWNRPTPDQYLFGNHHGYRLQPTAEADADADAERVSRQVIEWFRQTAGIRIDHCDRKGGIMNIWLKLCQGGVTR